MRYRIRPAVFLGVVSLLVVALWAERTEAAEYPIPRPTDQLTISYSAISPSFGALWVVKDAGNFDQNGLDIRLIFIQSSPTNSKPSSITTSR